MIFFIPVISSPVYKPTQNLLKSCIGPGLISGILRYTAIFNNVNGAAILNNHIVELWIKILLRSKVSNLFRSRCENNGTWLFNNNDNHPSESFEEITT